MPAATPTPTPAALGYSMPAEWERHEATWLAWPHLRSDWPGKFEAIPWVFAEMVRRIAPGELVHLLVENARHEAAARSVLRRADADLSRVRFFRIPTNRGWMRDLGPIFVLRRKPRREIAIVAFRFNGWAHYRNWRRDDRVKYAVARRLKLPLLRPGWRGRPMVLEGGAVDVNGRGSVLVTEECLLDQKRQPRNPGMSRAEVERALGEFLGARNVMWLGRGIAGDDTHGHIDDVCRFVGPRTVVLCREPRRRSFNHRALEENRERLRSLRLEDGSRPEVVDLPMPEPLWFDNQLLPASYANFYFTNAALLVPTFNDPADRQALGILSELVRDRPVVGIHAVDLVWGLGTLHCLTQQQPSTAK
jgi:agmatine deiminase